MEETSPFHVGIGFIVVRSILRDVHRHSGDEYFPLGFSLGGIMEGYSDCTLGDIRGKQGFKGEGWTSVKDAIRSTSGASPLCLHGRTGRDEYVTCVGKGQTKSEQEGNLWCKVCLHPHLEQGGTPPVERWRFLLSYRWELTIPASLL